jgi:hypothetical protein
MQVNAVHVFEFEMHAQRLSESAASIHREALPRLPFLFCRRRKFALEILHSTFRPHTSRS